MKRRFLFALLGVVAVASRARDELAAPLDASPATAWRTEDLDWVDATRQRSVPVRVYWPLAEAAERSGNALPLVVFSHGIGGSRRGYSYIGQHLASQGIASLHVQHIGSDRQLWWGNLLQLPDRLRLAAQPGEALERVKDVRFALNRLLTEQGARIDVNRLIMAGHSYGANTSLLLAGAAIPGYEGLAEPRFKAAVFISAPPLHGVDAPSQALAAIQVPTLHITCTEDVIRVPGYFSTAKERIALFEQTGSVHKWLAVFHGGSHSVFTDRGGTGGLAQNPRIKGATKRLVADFVRAVLDGHEERMGSWRSAHQGLLSQWVSP
jgi:pimeloyl-ACP methyl ester carboxylesterase